SCIVTPPLSACSTCSLQRSAHHRRLHSFPTRRSSDLMGISFPSPFGLAAGFDKAGIGTSALADLGFGHIEVGTITGQPQPGNSQDRKSTRLNSSHVSISYAVFCLKKKKETLQHTPPCK